MLKKLTASVLKAVLLLVTVSIVTFSMVEISPIDAVESYVGEAAVTAEQRAQIEVYWGLDEPPPVRYVKWAANLLRGDMGVSMIYRKPVIDVIAERFQLSLVLMAASWILSGVIGLLLGILMAVYRGSVADKLIRVYCLALESSPAFWIGMLLLLLFSVKLHLLPMGLASPVGVPVAEAALSDRVRHLILPALTLGLTGVSKITLQTGEKMRQVLDSDYAMFARARGESVWRIVFRHGLRNIMLPFITLQLGSVSELFGGSVLAETVFTYPGLGNATVQSALKGDIPLFLGITMFSALFVFGGNLLANILYTVADPRIREEGKK
ncbi:MAG: ABC transporter permease [Lachnospiraceae bacterium]|nr:ABC transporter permease [Lachnospiraceae bacterium]